MMSAKLWAPALTACALATSLALVGCSKDPKDAQQAGAAQQMPPTEVGVLVAQPQKRGTVCRTVRTYHSL